MCHRTDWSGTVAAVATWTTNQLRASPVPGAVPGETRAAKKQKAKFTTPISQGNGPEQPGVLPGLWPACSFIFLLSSLQVAGERYVYKFVCEPEALFSLAFPEQQRALPRAELERQISEEDTVPLSHLEENAPYLPDLGSLPPQLYGKGYPY